MSFCSNCGEKLVDGAKFCHGCGIATTENDLKNSREGKIEYSGKIFKCPNCGQELHSFEMVCPACGLELRDNEASQAVKEFAMKLEEIEARRVYENPSFFQRTNLSQVDSQKISLIQSFSIPNNKEDLLEFMILATSNINTKALDTTDSTISNSEKRLNDAWISKINQVYDKARLSYKSKEEFKEIQHLYDKCTRNIQKSKRKNIIKWVLMVGGIPILALIMMIYKTIWGVPNAVNNENERLEAIVVTIDEAIGNKEYKKALMYADSIEFKPKYRNNSSDKTQKEWDIKKELLIDEILNKAKQDGVELEYTPNEKNEDDNETEQNESGFIKGFNDAFDETMGDSWDNFQNNLEEIQDKLEGVSENTEGE